MNKTKMIETFGSSKGREKISICPLILDQDLQKCCLTSFFIPTNICFVFFKGMLYIDKEQASTYVELSLQIINQYCLLYKLHL